jgi:hypothetical protein
MQPTPKLRFIDREITVKCKPGVFAVDNTGRYQDSYVRRVRILQQWVEDSEGRGCWMDVPHVESE